LFDALNASLANKLNLTKSANTPLLGKFSEVGGHPWGTLDD